MLKSRKTSITSGNPLRKVIEYPEDARILRRGTNSSMERDINDDVRDKLKEIISEKPEIIDDLETETLTSREHYLKYACNSGKCSNDPLIARFIEKGIEDEEAINIFVDRLLALFRYVSRKENSALREMLVKYQETDKRKLSKDVKRLKKRKIRAFLREKNEDKRRVLVEITKIVEENFSDEIKGGCFQGCNTELISDVLISAWEIFTENISVPKQFRADLKLEERINNLVWKIIRQLKLSDKTLSILANKRSEFRVDDEIEGLTGNEALDHMRVKVATARLPFGNLIGDEHNREIAQWETRYDAFLIVQPECDGDYHKIILPKHIAESFVYFQRRLQFRQKENGAASKIDGLEEKLVTRLTSLEERIEELEKELMNAPADKKKNILQKISSKKMRRNRLRQKIEVLFGNDEYNKTYLRPVDDPFLQLEKNDYLTNRLWAYYLANEILRINPRILISKTESRNIITAEEAFQWLLSCAHVGVYVETMYGESAKGSGARKREGSRSSSGNNTIRNTINVRLQFAGLTSQRLSVIAQAGNQTLPELLIVGSPFETFAHQDFSDVFQDAMKLEKIKSDEDELKEESDEKKKKRRKFKKPAALSTVNEIEPETSKVEILQQRIGLPLSFIRQVTIYQQILAYSQCTTEEFPYRDTCTVQTDGGRQTNNYWLDYEEWFDRKNVAMPNWESYPPGSIPEGKEYDLIELILTNQTPEEACEMVSNAHDHLKKGGDLIIYSLYFSLNKTFLTELERLGKVEIVKSYKEDMEGRFYKVIRTDGYHKSFAEKIQPYVAAVAAQSSIIKVCRVNGTEFQSSTSSIFCDDIESVVVPKEEKAIADELPLYVGVLNKEVISGQYHLALHMVKNAGRLSIGEEKGYSSNMLRSIRILSSIENGREKAYNALDGLLAEICGTKTENEDGVLERAMGDHKAYDFSSMLLKNLLKRDDPKPRPPIALAVHPNEEVRTMYLSWLKIQDEEYRIMVYRKLDEAKEEDLQRAARKISNGEGIIDREKVMKYGELLVRWRQRKTELNKEKDKKEWLQEAFVESRNVELMSEALEAVANDEVVFKKKRSFPQVMANVVKNIDKSLFLKIFEIIQAKGIVLRDIPQGLFVRLLNCREVWKKMSWSEMSCQETEEYDQREEWLLMGLALDDRRRVAGIANTSTRRIAMRTLASCPEALELIGFENILAVFNHKSPYFADNHIIVDFLKIVVADQKKFNLLNEIFFTNKELIDEAILSDDFDDNELLNKLIVRAKREKRIGTASAEVFDECLFSAQHFEKRLVRITEAYTQEFPEEFADVDKLELLSDLKSDDDKMTVIDMHLSENGNLDRPSWFRYAYYRSMSASLRFQDLNFVFTDERQLAWIDRLMEILNGPEDPKVEQKKVEDPEDDKEEKVEKEPEIEVFLLNREWNAEIVAGPDEVDGKNVTLVLYSDDVFEELINGSPSRIRRYRDNYDRMKEKETQLIEKWQKWDLDVSLKCDYSVQDPEDDAVVTIDSGEKKMEMNLNQEEEFDRDFQEQLKNPQKIKVLGVEKQFVFDPRNNTFVLNLENQEEMMSFRSQAVSSHELLELMFPHCVFYEGTRVLRNNEDSLKNNAKRELRQRAQEEFGFNELQDRAVAIGMSFVVKKKSRSGRWNRKSHRGKSPYQMCKDEIYSKDQGDKLQIVAEGQRVVLSSDDINVFKMALGDYEVMYAGKSNVEIAGEEFPVFFNNTERCWYVKLSATFIRDNAEEVKKGLERPNNFPIKMSAISEKKAESVHDIPVIDFDDEYVYSTWVQHACKERKVAEDIDMSAPKSDDQPSTDDDSQDNSEEEDDGFLGRLRKRLFGG